MKNFWAIFLMVGLPFNISAGSWQCCIPQGPCPAGTHLIQIGTEEGTGCPIGACVPDCANPPCEEPPECDCEAGMFLIELPQTDGSVMYDCTTADSCGSAGSKCCAGKECCKSEDGFSGSCCSPGQECCNGSCCGEGEICCGGSCCPSGNCI